MPQIKLQDDEVRMIEELSPLKGDKASTTVKLRLVLEDGIRRLEEERSDVVQQAGAKPGEDSRRSD